MNRLGHEPEAGGSALEVGEKSILPRDNDSTALNGCVASRSGAAPLFSDVSTEERILLDYPLRRVRRLADQALDRQDPSICRFYP